MTRAASALAIVAVTLVSQRSVLAQETSKADPAWSISRVRGEVYRVQADGQVTVFLATPEGILLVDPFNLRVSAWLEQEFAARFPNSPVRYVVFSHHDERRVSGAARFRKAAEIVAHDEFASEGARTRARRGTARRPYANYTPPERTFDDRRAITLGGTTVELIHVPHADAADVTVAYFPRERIVFATDWLPVRLLPSAIGSVPSRTIKAARMLEALEFDTLVTGAGQEGTKGDVTLFREYLEELLARVRAGVKAGRTADESKRTLTLDRYAGWPNHATQRDANIEAMHRAVHPVVASVHASTHLNFQAFGPYACVTWMDSCDVTSRTSRPGGAIGATVTHGRIAVTAEIASGRTVLRRALQTDSFREHFEYVLEQRASVLSLLVGYSLVERGNTVISVDAGPSFVLATNGLTSFFSSRTTFSTWDKKALGFTAGATVVKPITSRLSMVIPTRLTGAQRGTSDIRSLSFSAAAGLRVNVARGAR